MSNIIVHGGRKLSGEIQMRSAKNSVLPLIAACVLSEKTITLKNCPPLSDILAMLKIIKSLGGYAEFDGYDIIINCQNITPKLIEKELTGVIRSSVFILGPLLSRFKQAKICHPGGCEIGKRPIDIHLDGLTALGVNNIIGEDIIECRAENMKCAVIDLKMPSVGATENLIMAAVLLSGTTIINNAAMEPEVKDLCDFINMLGGKILGGGKRTVIIEGVKSLGGGEYMPVSDRIVAGTYLSACAISGGKITLNGVNFTHIYSIIDRLQSCGCRFKFKKDSVSIISDGSLKAIEKTATMPYPGFPTDMQPQLTALLSTADGKSEIIENLFENRFKYVTQLKKMGADIFVEGKRAIITGPVQLKEATVEAHDLRGGAALILAALSAEGKSRILNAEHIDRGYYKIENDLKMLNADIYRKM